MAFKFSQADMASSNQLEAGWYPLKIVSITVKDSSKDPSNQVYHCKFEVVEGHPKAFTQILDYPNGKNLGKFISLLRCFDANPTPGKEYNEQDLVGKLVQGWCKFVDDGQYRNNKVDDFRPIGSK